MKDRIIQIMKEEKMNASRFSEAIGIQRAAISHLLAGRNNPSLDMIMKILNKFTTISPDWLLFGEGQIRRIQGNSASSANTFTNTFAKTPSGASADTSAEARHDLFSPPLQPDSPQANTRPTPELGIRDVREPGSNLSTAEVKPVENPPNNGYIHTETQFIGINEEESDVYIRKQEPKEIVRETIVYKERPEKRIDKLMILYSDETFESFIPEKHNDSRK
ncbi:MAG: helix-turn-helix domain-containing protein [Tannerella sp.]|jgi:transcriptional regulator with XRE-family HTH domain|nr:helix-turn-helix domain-containing protein [Tannerella sp.]